MSIWHCINKYMYMILYGQFLLTIVMEKVDECTCTPDFTSSYFSKGLGHNNNVVQYRSIKVTVFIPFRLIGEVIILLYYAAFPCFIPYCTYLPYRTVYSIVYHNGAHMLSNKRLLIHQSSAARYGMVWYSNTVRNGTRAPSTVVHCAARNENGNLFVRYCTCTCTCMTSAMVEGLSAYGQQMALCSTVTAVFKLCRPIRSTMTLSCDMYLSATSWTQKGTVAENNNM